MKHPQIYVLFFLLTSFIYSQDSNCELCECTDIKSDTEKYIDYTYSGCIDANGYYEGCGTLIKKDSTYKYVGIFKNNNYEGYGCETYYNADGSIDQQYVGNFKENKMSGEGSLLSFFTDQKQNSNGEFKNGQLYNGKVIINFDYGLIIEKKIEQYDEVNEIRNDRNYYNKDEIITNSDSTQLKIERRNNHLFFNMKLNDSLGGQWMFDTGGYGLSIGKDRWDYLLANGFREGIDYEDLNINSESNFGTQTTIKIFKVYIGEFIVKNVVANVKTEQSGQFINLVGVQFYDKFSDVKWSFNGEWIRFFR